MPFHKAVTVISIASFVALSGLAGRQTPAHAGTQATPSPTVLAADNFSDPTAGLFPANSPVPDKWQVAYLSGEYQIVGVDPNADDGTSVTTDASFGDMRVAVDARVDGDTTNTEFGVVCRWAAGNSPGGYELDVFPGTGAVSLTKLRGGQRMSLLLRDQDPDVLPAGQLNHLELTCAGRNITARVNGAMVGSAQDTTFTRGSAGMSVARAVNPGSISARFSNFTVTQP